MVRTRKKKKRNYKKAPKNTRVFRCVQKVKKKNDIGAAIAICQSSTKQSYRTGKTLKKGGGNIASHHRILHRCPAPNAPSSPWYQPKVGDIVQVKNNFRDTFILAKQQFKQNDFWKILEISQESDRCVVKLIKMENIGASNNYKKKVPILKGDITYIYYTNIAGNPDGRDDNFRLIKRKTPEVSDKPPTVVSPMKVDKLGWEKLGGRRKKKTRKKRGGSKSKRVKRLIKIFQQYPEIFPSGYFRFLGARLQNHIDKKTLWYKNGVILTWIKYQKTVKKKPKCIIKPGDVKLDQIVNKNQGNGAAKKIVLQFLKKFEKNRIWLEVRANNKRAIRFYKDRGFKRVCKIKFGEIPGIMMLKQV